MQESKKIFLAVWIVCAIFIIITSFTYELNGFFIFSIIMLIAGFMITYIDKNFG